MKHALTFVLCASTTLFAQTPDADKPRVFITDSQSWSIAGNSGGAGGAYGGHMAGGARPQDRPECPHPVAESATRAGQPRFQGKKDWASPDVLKNAPTTE